MPVYIWYPVLASLAVGFAFMNIPPLAGDFMILYGVSYGGLSLLLSALLWAHSLCQVPAGIIVDKIGAYRAVVVSCMVAIVVSLAPFLLPDNLTLAIMMRFILGLCTGLNFLSVLKIIGRLAPPEQTAKSQGYQGGAFCLGTMLPYLAFSFDNGLSWHWSYILCALMFSLVLLASLSLPSQAMCPDSGGRTIGTGRRLLIALPSILRSREIWALGLLHGLSYGTLNNLGQWLPSIMADLSGTTLASWTTAIMVILIIGTVSRSSSGSILAWVSKRTAILGVILALAILYIGLAFSGPPWLALGIGALLAAVSGLNYGSLFSLGGKVMPPEYMATALGFMNMVANLGNVGLTLILGYAKEFTGSFHIGLAAAGLSAFLALVLFGKTISRLDKTLSQRAQV